MAAQLTRRRIPILLLLLLLHPNTVRVKTQLGISSACDDQAKRSRIGLGWDSSVLKFSLPTD